MLDLFGEDIMEPTFTEVLEAFKLHCDTITTNSSRTANKFSELVRKAAEYIDELSAVEQEKGFARVSGLDPDNDINSDIIADTAQPIHMQHGSNLELEEDSVIGHNKESNTQTKDARHWDISRDAHEKSQSSLVN